MESDATPGSALGGEGHPRQTPRYAAVSPLRIFLAYAHTEFDLVARLASIIASHGFEPVWDRNFTFGHGFHDQIRLSIEHAHVFMPIITRQSSRRGWVHEEIGYATAFNVPVVPVSVGRDALPGEMLQMLQSLRLLDRTELPTRDSGDPLSETVWDDQLISQTAEEFRLQLDPYLLARLVDRFSDDTFPWYRCAAFPEQRAQMLTDAAKETLDLSPRGYHLFRQKGAMSSFCIPDAVLTDDRWLRRHGGNKHNQQRTPHYCTLLRDERIWLEKHAAKAGCHLILNLSLAYETYGDGVHGGPASISNPNDARLSRLECLREFLKRMSDDPQTRDMVRVVVNADHPEPHNITIIGNWSAAQSISAESGKGYRHTLFTRHAPNIERQIREFDAEMESLLLHRFPKSAGKPLRNQDTLQECLLELDRLIEMGQRPGPRSRSR